MARGNGEWTFPPTPRQHELQKELSEPLSSPPGVRCSCPVSLKLKIRLPWDTPGYASRTRFQKIWKARDLSRTKLGVTGTYLGAAIEPLVTKNRRTGSDVNMPASPCAMRSISSRKSS